MASASACVQPRCASWAVSSRPDSVRRLHHGRITQRKQTLHDTIAGTVVIKRGAVLETVSV